MVLSNVQGLTWESRAVMSFTHNTKTLELSKHAHPSLQTLHSTHTFKPSFAHTCSTRFTISKSFTWERMKNVSQPLFTVLTQAEVADRWLNHSSV